MVYTGTFERALDQKGRFLLPKRMRCELNEADQIYLTPGTEGCLEIHTTASLESLALRASRSAAGSKQVKSFSRLFYAQAQPCSVDGQGRIRIPKALMDHAHLDKEMVIVGVGFNWEIWDRETWLGYLNQHEDEFDRIAQSTFDQIETTRATTPSDGAPTNPLPR